MSDYTMFLTGRPSFLEGMARLADIAGALNSYNRSPNPEIADFLAIRSDWMAVGEDMRQAIESITIHQEPSVKE